MGPLENLDINEAILIQSIYRKINDYLNGDIVFIRPKTRPYITLDRDWLVGYYHVGSDWYSCQNLGPESVAAISSLKDSRDRERDSKVQKPSLCYFPRIRLNC